MRAKVTNVSKRKRLSRPSKPEFGMAGIVVGLVVGNIVGFVAEVTSGGGLLIMTAGTFAGVAIGGLFEALRFLRHRRRFHGARKS